MLKCSPHVKEPSPMQSCKMQTLNPWIFQASFLLILPIIFMLLTSGAASPWESSSQMPASGKEQLDKPLFILVCFLSGSSFHSGTTISHK